MTRIEEILSRALLVRERTVPRDIVPPATTTPPDASLIETSPEPDSISRAAAEDLRALCETLITHTSPTEVTEFVTDQLPGPRSALVLACVLQLTDTDDGARFWWQYAAGAGQAAAAYCLYLHHLALGEHDAANWWLHQTEDSQLPADSEPPEQQHHPSLVLPPFVPSDFRIADASTTTILQVLRNLGKNTARTRTRSQAVTELMAYIPIAVATGYLRQPDWEMPTPGPDFASDISDLLAAASPGTDAGPHDLLYRPHPHKRTTCKTRQSSTSRQPQRTHSQ